MMMNVRMGRGYPFQLFLLIIFLGHKNWVLCIAWSPDSSRLVSGCKNGIVIQWDPNTGEQKGQPMKGHTQWITALTWKPFHSGKYIYISSFF